MPVSRVRCHWLGLAILWLNLLRPMLLILKRQFSVDVLKWNIAREVDEILDRRSFGFLPGCSLVRRFVELRIVGDLGEIDFKGFDDGDGWLLCPSEQGLGISFLGYFFRTGLCTNGQQSCKRFFNWCFRREVVDRLIDEATG